MLIEKRTDATKRPGGGHPNCSLAKRICKRRFLTLQRLIELIRKAAEPPTPRKATQPAYANLRRRLEMKGRRATLKKLRTKKPDESV
jgi:hypothetical protein